MACCGRVTSSRVSSSLTTSRATTRPARATAPSRWPSARQKRNTFTKSASARAELETDIGDATYTLRALLAERRTLMRYAPGDADVAKIARRKADTIRATITALRDLRSELTSFED